MPGRLPSLSGGIQSPLLIAGRTGGNGERVRLSGPGQENKPGLASYRQAWLIEKELEEGGRIYNVSRETFASGAAWSGAEPPIPNIRADFPHFGSKIVGFLRYQS